MSTGTWLLILGGGALAWYFLSESNRTNNPVGATSAVYVPPPQAVPTYGGRPSPAAPGAMGWGFIPPQPTGAQDAAAVISAIGGLASGIGDIVSAARE